MVITQGAKNIYIQNLHRKIKNTKLVVQYDMKCSFGVTWLIKASAQPRALCPCVREMTLSGPVTSLEKNTTCVSVKLNNERKVCNKNACSCVLQVSYPTIIIRDPLTQKDLVPKRLILRIRPDYVSQLIFHFRKVILRID